MQPRQEPQNEPRDDDAAPETKHGADRNTGSQNIECQFMHIIINSTERRIQFPMESMITAQVGMPF